jgi:hypothetical protein
MLRNTQYFGISMTTQRNRRLLVIITYVGFAALVLVHALRHHGNSADLTFFVLICVLLAGRAAFGYLVPVYPFSIRAASVSAVPEVKSLMHPELNERFRDDERDPEPPDEREIVVRNRAYYVAFNTVMVYTLALSIVGGFASDPQFSSRLPVAAIAPYALLPILLMATTLPQAIILWTEPDLPADPA